MQNIDIEAQKGRRRPYPHRLDGFPSLSYFMVECAEGSIFRKFNRLSVRNLLYLQSNVNELQGKLDSFDEIDAERARLDANLETSAKFYIDLKGQARQYAKKRKDIVRGDSNGTDTIGEDAFERIELHRQIKEAMREYRKCEALIQAKEVMNFSAPSNRALATFGRYFYTEKDRAVLRGCDAKLLEDPDDLITLVQSNDDRLTRTLRSILGPIFRDSKRDPQPGLDIYFFSENRIQLASYTISILCSSILLVGAMACLSILDNHSWKVRLGILALFTILFAIFVGLLTNAKRAEIFASTAAYAAVLVVYVSANLGPIQPTS